MEIENQVSIVLCDKDLVCDVDSAPQRCPHEGATEAPTMAGVLRGRVSACEGPRGASTEPRPRARWRDSALPCAVVSSGLRWHFLISQTPFWTSSLSQSVHRENAFAETPSRDTEELSAGRRAEGLTAEAPSLDRGALSSLRSSVDCCLPFTAHVLRAHVHESRERRSF